MVEAVMGMGFVCLCYHRIAPVGGQGGDAYTVRADRFRRQMAWLAARGGVGVTVSEARREGRGLALSFDDGYADFYEEAWPVLREYGFRATVFVVAGRAGKTADWEGADGSRLMGWDTLGELAAAGCEIGAHGLTHRPLDVATEDELREEMEAGQRFINQYIGTPPSGIAYPYGRWSERVVKAAAAAGYEWAATVRGGHNRRATPRLRLRRTVVRARDVDFGFALKVITGYASLIDMRMDLLGLP
jgi:peptidoglycan/xylan/chitin deacetylase (PgdA/CDA1 family)